MLETIVPEPCGSADPARPSRLRSEPVRPDVAPRPHSLASTRMAISAGARKGMQVGTAPTSILRRGRRRRRTSRSAGSKASNSSSTCSARMPGAGAARGAQPSKIRRPRKPMGDAHGRDAGRLEPRRPGIFAPMLEQMRANSPDTYRMMFTERNSRWADWIASRLQAARHGVRRGRRPAISPARTASRPSSPSSASAPRGSTDGPSRPITLPFGAPPLGRALPEPWSSLEAWRGIYIWRKAQ